MLALQETQSAPANAYAIVLAAFDEAYRNMKTCSGNIQALLSERNVGLAGPELRARIASAGQAYETARAECIIASAKLNQYLIAKIVSSRPAIQEAQAPDH